MLLQPVNSVSELKEGAEVALNVLLNSLDEHAVFSNPYFEFLKNNKWNASSYELHRANFFYRTELTVKAIAQTCARAALQDDNSYIIF